MTTALVRWEDRPQAWMRLPIVDQWPPRPVYVQAPQEPPAQVKERRIRRRRRRMMERMIKRERYPWTRPDFSIRVPPLRWQP